MKACLNLSECNGIGDLICATPTIRKLHESYGEPIVVLSKMPELFKRNLNVSCSYKHTSVDWEYFERNYVMHNSFYNVGKKNERGIEYKHNVMDIRQFHAINLGFMLAKSELQCDYLPTDKCRVDIPDSPYFVIHPVQNWGSRSWSEDNWVRLTEWLTFVGYKVVAIGKDSSETGFFNVEKPTYELKSAEFINYMNKTSISDAWHLINNAAGVITMDSGILHLAGTSKTHIYHLGSSINPEFRKPYRAGMDSKYHYIHGNCSIFCGSDMKYGVKEWGSIQGVPPLIKCLEGYSETEFACHPLWESVTNMILVNHQRLN
jgi:hypothetical protein